MSAIEIGTTGGYPLTWRRWALDVTDAGVWSLRTLTQGAAVALAWPLRLFVQIRRGSSETRVSVMVLGLPALALARWLPLVVWPTWEQALVDLQRAAVVLGVVFLALTFMRMRHGGGRACCASGHRHLVPSPDGTKTWRWIVSVHEAGHLVVGKKLGRRTGKAKITSGGGLTIVHPKRHDLIGEIAIDMAGGIAARTQEGCGGDYANAAARIRKYGRKQDHHKLMAVGTRKAHSLVAMYRGEILRTARQIYDRGWAR